VQVTRATFIPLLAAKKSDRFDPGAVREDFCGDLTVVYSYGPQFGRRVVTHAELEQMELSPHTLRRSALEHLEVLAGRAEFHGQPPSLMLSFQGLESSLLLATDFWTRLQGAVPGDLVVGVPTRDVVIVTGSQSGPGLEKARRCVDRVLMAGDEFPLTSALLVRRGGVWEPFDGQARQPARAGQGIRQHHGPAQPPRQYQEHPSWPGERVAPVSPMRPGAPVAGDRRGPAGRPHAAPPLVPAAAAMAPAIGSPAVAPRPAAASHAPAAPVPTQPAGPPRPGASTLPTTGSIPAVAASGFAMPMPAMPASVSPAGPVPAQRRGTDRWRSDDPRPVDIAPYSAVPYSAMPYSAAPYSAAPYSAAPYSGVPYSAVPYSGAPYRGASYSRSRGAQQAGRPLPYEAPKPPYRDEPYSTGMQPRQSDPDATGSQRYLPSEPPYRSPVPLYRSEPSRPAYNPAPPPEAHDTHAAPAPQPAYPASWGTTPDWSAGRSAEWRSSPRARFSR
jgi:hypothetical protein